MKAATAAAATTTEPSNGGGGGKRKVETDLDDTMARICGRATKRRRRLTLLNERNNNASDMILNDGEMTDALTSQPQATSTPDKTRSTTESQPPPPPPPPTNDTQTFPDVSLATMPADLDDTVPFDADDFLDDDDDDELNHESGEEHVRDLELPYVNLPEMVDVPPPTPSAPDVAGRKEMEDFGDLVQRELVGERADLDGRKLSVLYKTQNEYRAEAWKGSDKQKIYDNKYVINADTQKIDCYTVSDKCLSFTAKVIARSNIPIRVNISVGNYQSAENGHAKIIYIPAEDLGTYCQHLTEILEGSARHPNQSRRFTVNTNDIIVMETTSTELVIKQVVPDDIKKLSQELATRRKALGSSFFEAKKDAKVTITLSEVASYIKSMKLAYEFVSFMKTCNAMRLATFNAVTQRFCRTPERFHPKIYYENVVSEYHNLKVEPKYKWPIAIVMKNFVNSFANESYAQNFNLSD